MTSDTRGAAHWVLRFERSLPLYLEPLMGWTADDDPIADVELKFGSLNSAIRFAERQGINYRVQDQRHAPERATQHDN
jgi:ETC complex I subunit-like protein